MSRTATNRAIATTSQTATVTVSHLGGIAPYPLGTVRVRTSVPL